MWITIETAPFFCVCPVFFAGKEVGLEGDAEKNGERKKEFDCIGVCIFSEIFTSCYMYVFMCL
jgi:hypothetical protein